MTIEQISASGVPTNTWIGMGQFCDIISLQDDNCFFPRDDDQQFYFESSSNLMFIRYLENVVKTKDTTNKPNTVIITYNGETYRASIQPNGAEDKTVGRYHDVICISDIAAFLKHKRY